MKCPVCLRMTEGRKGKCPHCGCGISPEDEISEESSGMLYEDHYRITGIIKQGSNCIVYRAEDLDLDSASIIRKIDFNQPVNKEKTNIEDDFPQKAKLLTSLDYSGLPKVYDYFTAPDENGAISDFLVMLFFDGEDLKTVLKKSSSPMPLEDAAEICIQIADVLTYLHSLPVPLFYGEIKPSEVLLKDDGDIVLTDVEKLRTVGEDGIADSIREDVRYLGIFIYYMFTGKIPGSPDKFKPASSFNSDIPKRVDEMISSILNSGTDMDIYNACEVSLVLEDVFEPPCPEDEEEGDNDEEDDDDEDFQSETSRNRKKNPMVFAMITLVILLFVVIIYSETKLPQAVGLNIDHLKKPYSVETKSGKDGEILKIKDPVQVVRLIYEYTARKEIEKVTGLIARHKDDQYDVVFFSQRLGGLTKLQSIMNNAKNGNFNLEFRNLQFKTVKSSNSETEIRVTGSAVLTEKNNYNHGTVYSRINDRIILENNNGAWLISSFENIKESGN
ncbi:MAG: protein kinase [Firmicutes bacterium]|nr:protein kinase [Bacillota bacterium]